MQSKVRPRQPSCTVAAASSTSIDGVLENIKTQQKFNNTHYNDINK